MTDRVVMEIVVFGVGSADCIHVQYFEGTKDIQFLIDTGISSTFSRVRDILVGKNKRIDFIVLTHDHADHIDGLSAFLEEPNFHIKRVFYWTQNVLPGPANRKRIQQMIRKAIALEFDPVSLEPGLRPFNVFWGNKIEVLHPWGDLPYLNKPNNDSVILALKFGNVNLLFMGDATTREENVILNRNYQNSEIDFSSTTFLKVGHHGSNTSSGRMFLSTISQSGTTLAVCSCKSQWASSPPNSDKLNEIRSIVEGNKGKLIFTGQNNETKDQWIIVKEIAGEIVIEDSEVSVH